MWQSSGPGDLWESGTLGVCRGVGAQLAFVEPQTTNNSNQLTALSFILFPFRRGRCKEEVKVAESLHGGLRPRLGKSVAQGSPCVMEHSPAIKVLL